MKREHEWLDSVKDFFLEYPWVMMVLAVGITFFMAYCDYQAMFLLFRNSAEGSKARVLSALYAVFLEGIPFFSAPFVARRFVKHKYRKNEKIYSDIVIFLAAVGLSICFYQAIYLRRIAIMSHCVDGYVTPMDAYMDGVYKEYLMDIFLQYSPIITSILSFIASWGIAKVDADKELEGMVKRLKKKFLRKEKQFELDWKTLVGARRELWTMLTNHQKMEEVKGDIIPDHDEAFKRDCYNRMWNRLIEDCISTTPDLIKEYQNTMETQLQRLLLDMSKCSSIPAEIMTINIGEALREYDQQERKRGNLSWNFDIAEDELMERLKLQINNETVVAQSNLEMRSTFNK